MAEGKKRRQRRSFTEEFKAQVVQKILAGSRTAGQAARDLDLTETAEREELARLRKENWELREDRELPRNASAFFAKQPR